jgi:REP element-mobilizing transposase RayT
MPHHVTHRGNRRQQTFFYDADYETYLELMSTCCRAHRGAAWVYCLMPNHVHLIAVPERKESLVLAIGEAHRRYPRRINFREGWRGHLWQGRFSSFIMDERHLMACAIGGIQSGPRRIGEPATTMALEQCGRPFSREGRYTCNQSPFAEIGVTILGALSVSGCR